MTNLTVVDRARFLKLVVNNAISPSLKTYSDTLLFYYIGYLAAKHNQGHLLEIGIGGSTYVLYELSQNLNRMVHLVDISQNFLDAVNYNDFYADISVNPLVIPSEKLYNISDQIGNVCYCHIDGSKDYNITKSDLRFCIEQLDQYGIICQDDYGNNKWPSVTDAVKDLVYEGKASVLIVGDSSVWLTKPAAHHYWMQALQSDYEMSILAHFVNLSSAKSHLNVLQDYYFMNSATVECILFQDSLVIDYFNRLCHLDHENYLKMPYSRQSSPGYYAVSNKQDIPYRICLDEVWRSLRGADWPKNTPKTKHDIDKLPAWIIHELTHVHQINLYEIDTLSPIFKKKISTCVTHRKGNLDDNSKTHS